MLISICYIYQAIHVLRHSKAVKSRGKWSSCYNVCTVGAHSAVYNHVLLVRCTLQTHQRTHTSHVPAMPKNVPPARLKERSAAAAQPAEKVPLSAPIKYTEESRPMRLDEATEYFSSSLPKAFIAIEGVHSSSGSEGLATGE